MKKTVEEALFGVEDVARNAKMSHERLRDLEKAASDAEEITTDIVRLYLDIEREEMPSTLFLAVQDAVEFAEEVGEALDQMHSDAADHKSAVKKAQ
jgi:hypothetical protein